MYHRWFAAMAILIAVTMSGCMCIEDVGTGCCDTCNQCDDCGPRPIPANPWQCMRQLHRSCICGGGCGDVYYGEWMSTPADCVDPCDSCQEWTDGCGTKCLPCVRLHSLLSCLAGRRFHCDDSPGLINICSLCGEHPCEAGCDRCESCCGDEVYSDDDVIIPSEEISSEMYDDAADFTTSHVHAGGSRPTTRARVVSSRSSLPTTGHKPSCNCGQHAP